MFIKGERNDGVETRLSNLEAMVVKNSQESKQMLMDIMAKLERRDRQSNDHFVLEEEIKEQDVDQNLLDCEETRVLCCRCKLQ